MGEGVSLSADRADAIVVLGAAVLRPGVPGPAMARRVAHAVRVMKCRQIDYLVVSGGIVGPPPAEAEVMRRLAVVEGVDPARIVVEDRARNTFENAVYTGRIMRDRGWRRVVVVTDAFHMRRALYAFRRIGLVADGEAVTGLGGMSRWTWCAAHARELRALAYSAWLFALGRHKAIVARVWEQ